MPLYEYQCESCGARFELIRKFSDPPLDACPTCQGPVRKLVSSPAFHLKGSGWYATDYAKKTASTGEKKAGESVTAATADSAAKEPAKLPTEKAPAAKPSSSTEK